MAGGGFSASFSKKLRAVVLFYVSPQIVFGVEIMYSVTRAWKQGCDLEQNKQQHVT